MIRTTALALALAVSSLSAAWAQSHSQKEIAQDIERHKAMASAHTAAAQCLAAGRQPDDCLKELQNACKGLAIGKHCGMRHAH